MEVIIAIICIIVFYAMYKYPDWKFDNSLPPNGYQTDWNAVNRDLNNGKPRGEVINKHNRGEYYVKKK